MVGLGGRGLAGYKVGENLEFEEIFGTAYGDSGRIDKGMVVFGYSEL